MSTPTPHHVVIVERTNGLGTAGFIVSLVGFLSCGFLSPIGLVLSLIALGRQPRGLAIAGFVLGLIGSIWLIVALALGLFAAIFGIFWAAQPTGP